MEGTERFELDSSTDPRWRNIHLSAKLDDAVDFFSRAISVNRDGPLEEILKLWDSKDRNDVRKTASDPAVFEANRQFFRSITSSRLLAKIDYGAYAIFFIAHSIPSDKGLC